MLIASPGPSSYSGPAGMSKANCGAFMPRLTNALEPNRFSDEDWSGTWGYRSRSESRLNGVSCRMRFGSAGSSDSLLAGGSWLRGRRDERVGDIEVSRDGGIELSREGRDKGESSGVWSELRVARSYASGGTDANIRPEEIERSFDSSSESSTEEEV